MDERKITFFSKIFSVGVALLVVGYIFYRNYPPFGEYVILSESQISDLAPETRVILYPKPPAQISDYIYFKTKSKGYDTAKVSISFKADPEQELHLGFSDRPSWHYKTSPIYLPLIENLSWEKIGTKPFLYQKNPVYTSVENFLVNPPNEDVVGTAYMNEDHSINVLAAYTPSAEQTLIDQPLRGGHTFYTYINNEPFNLSIEKQDLNWYEGEDLVQISVYKNEALVTEKVIQDDGVSDNSKIIMLSQKEEIIYTGGNPENGLYKIVLTANSDTIIKSIRSSFSRIVFEEPIYPIGASLIYDQQFSGITSPSIYTDATRMSFSTPHQSSTQVVRVNSNEIKLEEAGVALNYSSNSNRNLINIPNGDIKIEGVGFFAFNEDHYFTPFIYKKFEVKEASDLLYVSYFLTDYKTVYNSDDGWKTTEVEFDLKDAHYSKGMLSWTIKAPGLKNKGGKVHIKDIKVELHKKAIINF